jgi:hypothetical protein
VSEDREDAEEVEGSKGGGGGSFVFGCERVVVGAGDWDCGCDCDGVGCLKRKPGGGVEGGGTLMTGGAGVTGLETPI